MGLTFSPLHPVFAAECCGIDIGEPISPAVATQIEDGMDRYGVLVFRRKHDRKSSGSVEGRRIINKGGAPDIGSRNLVNQELGICKPHHDWLRGIAVRCRNWRILYPARDGIGQRKSVGLEMDFPWLAVRILLGGSIAARQKTGE